MSDDLTLDATVSYIKFCEMANRSAYLFERAMMKLPEPLERLFLADPAPQGGTK